MKPHKHAELIKAWADGAIIELKDDYGCWEEVAFPSWMLDKQYRIKPEPKPDVVKKIQASTDSKNFYCWDTSPYPNLKLTFDGETGELKSAEVLK